MIPLIVKLLSKVKRVSSVEHIKYGKYLAEILSKVDSLAAAACLQYKSDVMAKLILQDLQLLQQSAKRQDLLKIVALNINSTAVHQLI